MEETPKKRRLYDYQETPAQQAAEQGGKPYSLFPTIRTEAVRLSTPPPAPQTTPLRAHVMSSRERTGVLLLAGLEILTLSGGSLALFLVILPRLWNFPGLLALVLLATLIVYGLIGYQVITRIYQVIHTTRLLHVAHTWLPNKRSTQ